MAILFIKGDDTMKKNTLLLLFSLLCLMTGTVSHAKATEFKGLFEDSYVGLDEPVQHGSYYFKYQEDGIYMADAENGSYKKLPLPMTV